MKNLFRTVGAISSFLTLALIVASSSPALGLTGTYHFWTTASDANPLPYSECLRRAPLALAAVAPGAPEQTLGSLSSTFTSASNDYVVFITCIAQGRGFYMALQVVGSDNANVTSYKVETAVANVFWGNPNSPIGSWRWFDGNCVTFNADGSAVHSAVPSQPGHWQQLSDGSYQVHWPSFNSTDSFTISGNALNGNFNGTRGQSTRAASC